MSIARIALSRLKPRQAPFARRDEVEANGTEGFRCNPIGHAPRIAYLILLAVPGGKFSKAFAKHTALDDA